MDSDRKQILGCLGRGDEGQGGKGEGNTKGQEETREMVNMFIILIVVMVFQMYTYVKTY